MNEKELKEEVQAYWEAKMDEIPENHQLPEELQEKLQKAGWI